MVKVKTVTTKTILKIAAVTCVAAAIICIALEIYVVLHMQKEPNFLALCGGIASLCGALASLFGINSVHEKYCQRNDQ